jgi:FAD/FMN-containing dehydrogenase
MTACHSRAWRIISLVNGQPRPPGIEFRDGAATTAANGSGGVKMSDVTYLDLDGNQMTMPAEAVEAFIEAHRGPCLQPGDGGYDEARVIWNGSADKRPAIIARCAGAADVIDAVNFAREQGILVAIRGGGHNVAGNAVCDGGLMIDLSLMNGVRVDPSARRARAGGGATLGDVDRETQAFGLAAPLGVVSLTGIAGLTLCGGMGWLRRKHGMACDALVSADVVTADGRFLTASESENPDLFWALRGGGGNFGVVTSFEYELYPVGPMVTLCAPFYPLEKGTDVLRFWRDFVAEAPEDFASNFLLWSIPAHPNFPEELHGTAVVIPAGVHIGDPNEGEHVVQPLRELGETVLDLSGPIPYAAVQAAFDPLFLKGERLNYWKSLYLDTLDEDAIGNAVARGLNRPDPWALIAIWHLGGAMNRVDSAETALGERSANYLYSLDTSWTDPADNESAIAWTREAWAEMKPFSRGGSYLNFPGQGEEGEELLRASYGSDNYDRLVKIKTQYDPSNMFRLNQNILPSK